MPLPREAVLGILADNLDLRGSALPLPKKVLTRWADGLQIPHGGETVLYTGHMYQLIPTIEAMAERMALLENSWVTDFMKWGRVVNRVINVSRIMARAKRERQEAHDRMLRNIALLLMKADVKFGYLYGDEMYSGALAYDQGLDEIFIRHAQRVADLLRRYGVKQVITVDPHTTNMLRHVYPEVIPGFDVGVRSYLEVLAERELQPEHPLDREVAIHDSCVYARYEGVVDQPRSLLTRAGATVREPRLSGALTHCCGGPIESLFPSKAREIACQRVEQFVGVSDRVVSACPICLVNLEAASRGGPARFADISTVLAEAFLDGAGKSSTETHTDRKE